MKIPTFKNGDKLTFSDCTLAYGHFDLVHPGHLNYFKEAKSYGDILVVSITADKFVNKGINKPYFKQSFRLDFLSSLEIVDYVFCSNSNSAINVIENLKPSFLTKAPKKHRWSSNQVESM